MDNNIFHYKDNYFLSVDNLDMPIPLPGDILVEKGESAKIILCSEVGKDSVSLTLFGDRCWLPGRSGAKVWTAKTETVLIDKSNLSNHIIRRGRSILYPIPFAQKIINFFIKMNINIKSKFNKKKK